MFGIFILSALSLSTFVFALFHADLSDVMSTAYFSKFAYMQKQQIELSEDQLIIRKIPQMQMSWRGNFKDWEQEKNEEEKKEELLTIFFFYVDLHGECQTPGRHDGPVVLIGDSGNISRCGCKDTFPFSSISLHGFWIIGRWTADWKQTNRSGLEVLAVLISNRWCNPRYVTVKEHLCAPDVELLTVSFHPCLLLGEFTCYLPAL